MGNIEKYMSKDTKQIKIGNRFIGNGNDILIQSMTKTDTCDIKSTILQIHNLEKEGCDIIRCAVPDINAAKCLKEIKNNINIPLVADIHFDYKLAIESIKNGADKIRINPGNINNLDNIKEIVKAAKYYNIPIRIGINSGSLEETILKKYKKVCPEALVESAVKNIKIFENFDFYNLVISIKSSNTIDTIKSCELLSKKCNYPLHIGVTEAGNLINSIIKSSICISTLLQQNIGDTIRISITDNPVKEVEMAKKILNILKIRYSKHDYIDIVSCPTCGRTKIDVISLTSKIEKKLKNIRKNIKVGVMGCVVNGIGESKDTDISVCGGIKEGLIIKKGKILKKVPEEKIVDCLYEEILKM